MSKYLLTISAIAMLSLCACKGRHADGTPLGETVEVIFPDAGQSAVEAPEVVKLSDSIVYTDTATAQADTTKLSN